METVDELKRARLGISKKSQITELYEKIYPGSDIILCGMRGGD